MARWTYGEPLLVVRELLPDYELPVFRIVKTDNIDDLELVNSFKSHYEIGRMPRGGAVRPAILHMGISVYLRPEDARETARKWPVIGAFVALLQLTSGQGFNIAETGHPGHRTVWGDPFKLRNTLVDIVSV
jgi:hypothetical protein